MEYLHQGSPGFNSSTLNHTTTLPLASNKLFIQEKHFKFIVHADEDAK